MSQFQVPAQALRAGYVPNGQVTDRPHVAAAATTARTYFADVSEFQPDIADATYLKWSKAIAIRALYGTSHVDKAWYGGARRQALHDGGAKVVLIYQYLVAGQDAAAQARAFVKLVGPLKPGELPVCDLEEGSGSQTARWDAWAAVIRSAYGINPWLYSGLSFSKAHGLDPEWVAAYQSSAPSVRWTLWQFTDGYSVPGVGHCDCSVFAGTVDELAAHAYRAPQPKPAPKPAPAPAPKPVEEDMPDGLLTAAQNVPQPVSFKAGTVSQVVVYAPYAGIQDTPPKFKIELAHTNSTPYSTTFEIPANGNYVYSISSNDDCPGVTLTRLDDGPALAAYHTN